MTRREMLVRMFGAVVAAAVAPLIDLTDSTPAFWNQAPIKALMPWRIMFPDGTTFSFDATVIAERVLRDGGVELTLRPSGETKMSQEISYPINYSEGPNDGRVSAVPSLYAPATMLTTGEGKIVELQEIEMPELSRDIEDGPLKRSDVKITISGRWKE